jgi:hypothetical protein
MPQNRIGSICKKSPKVTKASKATEPVGGIFTKKPFLFFYEKS